MMDFGTSDLEALAGPENRLPPRPQLVSDSEATKLKMNGSGFFIKQPRSGSCEDDWRSSKVARTDGSDSPKTMLNLQLLETPMLPRSNSMISGDGGRQLNMLSFSSPRSEAPSVGKNGGLFAERNAQNHPPSSHYHHSPYGSYARNAGVHAPILGARGVFTASQWAELEHQALIYKYILANVPVPPNLIITLKNSFNPYGLSGFSSGSFAPNSLGWSSFHLGFSGNTDPEPGRCRRTDGKKWRCSRDAVADQKYCERHINRGRHRSRKPVEGQTGQVVSGSTTKVSSISCSTSATVVVSGSSASNTLDITQHQFKALQPGAQKPSADVLVNRIQDRQSLSMVSPSTNLKSKDYPFSIPKEHNISAEESLNSGFGLVFSDSLLNPSRKISCMNSKNYNSIVDFDNRESQDQHPLRHFIDDWPKNQSNDVTISSSAREKITLSPLRLSHELDPIQMGLKVNKILGGSTEKQTNLVPLSWGSSMGGPLGEVLSSGFSTVGEGKKSAFSLTTGGVWNGCPFLGSSPTGVLQKTTFVSSLSNSSSGSSPRAGNRQNYEMGSNLGDDILASTLVSSFSIPSLQ